MQVLPCNFWHGPILYTFTPQEPFYQRHYRAHDVVNDQEEGYFQCGILSRQNNCIEHAFGMLEGALGFYWLAYNGQSSALSSNNLLQLYSAQFEETALKIKFLFVRDNLLLLDFETLLHM